MVSIVKLCRKFLLAFGVFALLSVTACSDSSDSLQGYIEGEPIYVSSYFTGKLLQLNVDRGTMVKTGDVLFKLEKESEYRNLMTTIAKVLEEQEQLRDLQTGSRATVLLQKKSERNRIISELKLAKRNYERMSELLKTGDIDRSSFDKFKTDYLALIAELQRINAALAEAEQGARIHAIKAQEAALVSAKEQVKNMQWHLEQKTVQAPGAGRVLDVFFWPGEVVPATSPVLSLLTKDHINAIFFVPERILSTLKIKQTVLINCDSCQRPTPAKISYIASRAEYTPPVIYSEKTRSKLVYMVRAIFPADVAMNFHPGQPIDVTLSKNGA